MNKAVRALLCAGSLSVTAAVTAQDVSRGAALYDNHCFACHREGLHDRAHSKVATYADLRSQVERWARQSGRRFTPDEIEELIEFLDASHYRLDRRGERRDAKR